MTRGHTFKKLHYLAISSIMMIPTQGIAQFKKFESKSRFKPSARAAAPTQNVVATPPVNDQSQTSANDQTFGSRNEARPKDKKSKYVQLNPETGFGPEIITSFDFPDTDIMEITRHMQKLTGINLILDKAVKGKVSITAPSAITVGDAWSAYLAALDMAGFTLVKSGAFYKVIQTRDVRYVPTTIYTGAYTPETEAHVMKIISLKNVDANEISRNFRPFMSRYGRIIDIKQTNTVIIADTGSNISRLEKLIKFLDVPGFEESLHIIPVKNSSAQEIAKLLDDILKGSSSSGGSSAARSRTSARSSSRFSSSSSSSNTNISKIIAEQRTNSIIAMANAEGARQLRELINKLDVKLVSSSSGRIHVHYLNFGNAEELAKTLSSLVSGASSSSGGAANNARSFVRAQEDTNLFSGEVKVTADKNNNALVVTASPTDWLTLKDVIGKLDIPRDQVYVEALIMETSVSKLRSFGTEFLGAYGAGNASRGGLVSGGAGTGGLVDLLSGNPTSMGGFFAGFGDGGTYELPNPAGGDPIVVNSINGVIKAIASNTSSNVLATPQILAMDNTEAEFEVGETRPIRQTTTASNGTQQTTTSNQEAKLSLKITPQINKQTRFVKLKINQSFNDFKGESSTDGTGQATVVRSAVTEVMVKDQDTIAMGGLLRDQESVTHNKVPLLGDIPVLGWLFKNKRKKIDKVNLLMFMTPKILTPYNKIAAKNSLEILKRSTESVEKSLEEGTNIFKDKVERIAKGIKGQDNDTSYQDTMIDTDEAAEDEL